MDAPVSRSHASHPMPDSVLMKAEQVCRRYGTSEILRGIDLTIATGERVGIMGPSGSGKSTLLHCLGGIDRPDSGEIWWEQQCINRLDHRALATFRREQISTIFQFFHLLPTLTVFENIEFPLNLLGIPAPERLDQVRQLINEVGLSHRQDAFPDELSGGEMQRVAIARALVHRPRLILADEPTGNLDTHTGEIILDLLASLTERHRTALVLVTHSEAATRICSRTVQMRDGRILEPAHS